MTLVLKLIMLGCCLWFYYVIEHLFGVAHTLTKILGLLKSNKLSYYV